LKLLTPKTTLSLLTTPVKIKKNVFIVKIEEIEAIAPSSLPFQFLDQNESELQVKT